VIRAIANKRLDLNNAEYQVYQKIISIVDKHEFDNLFETDSNGKIISVFPPIDKQVSMVVVYFLFNIMINQRARSFDSVIKDVEFLKSKISQMENK